MNILQIDILKQAIQRNGIERQLDMVSEEIGEYLQAVNKLKRLGGVANASFYPPELINSREYSLAYFGLCSEVADLKIMINQVELMLNQEAIDLAENRKIERLKKRLDKNGRTTYS